MHNNNILSSTGLLSTLNTKPKGQIVPEVNQDREDTCLCFLSTLEGFKTRCKNLHWSAPRKNIHVYLDEFLEILSDYQDALAEEYMGISGQFAPNKIVGTPPSSLTFMDFIIEVRVSTHQFYNTIPEDCMYAGIKSECETFMHNINKYKYLFSLCE